MSNATQATIALFLFVLIGLIIVSLSQSPAAILFTNTPVVGEQPVIIQSETELQLAVPTVAPAANVAVEGVATEDLPLLSHTVQSGERLFTIARTYSTTVDAIMQLNPQLTDPDVIVPGQQLVIPRP